MSSLRVIIVDDEEDSRKVLRHLLTRFCPAVQIIGEASNASDAYSLAEKEKPQLVFLDIQMPESDGFSLLKKYMELPFDVVFITSYNQYAINAIKFNALDYLLKPVEVEDLREAIRRAEKKIMTAASKQIQIINLLNNIEEAATDRTLVVHQNKKVIMIKTNSISHIEADNRYSNITTANHEKYTISKTLKELTEFLSDNPSFVRVNKNVIINIHFILDYSKGEPCIIEMQNGTSFDISRRKKHEVLERIKR